MARSTADALALLIVLLGFGLRAQQHGVGSFWSDEAGQALAAVQPTVGGLLSAVREHVMALPLDYFLSRVTAHAGLKEAVMRFPAVIWGTLTLALCYTIAKRLTTLKTALIAALLLSMSAFHIHFSQEMRFYAGLSFLYLLATALLLRALDNNTVLNWFLFLLTASVGTYFHPYVLLSIVNGFLYLLVAKYPIDFRDQRLIALGASTIALVLIFLPGYLQFGARDRLGFDLFPWNYTPVRMLLTGFGWIAYPYSAQSPAFDLWGMLGIGFAVVGAGVILSRLGRCKALASLVLGVVIQIILILLADWIKGYWFASRQILHLMPVIVILTAVGVVHSAEWIARAFRSKRLANWAIVGAILLFALAAAPRLTDYFGCPKGNGRQLVDRLLQYHEDGEPILVIPGYEHKVYHLYLLQSSSGKERVHELRPTSWSQLLEVASEASGALFLIAPVSSPVVASDEQLISIESLGFTPLLLPPDQCFGSRALYLRQSTEQTN